MNPNALALFVKAPVAGQCKTRLTPPLSPEDARALYVAFCLDIFSTAASLPGVDVWIAYQPHAEFPAPAWLVSAPSPSYAGHFLQEGADLGGRLIHCFKTLFDGGYKAVCILGTDAPSLPRRFIPEAFASLKNHAAVFGPAEDGGYYLTGLARPIPTLFQNISWSTPDVMEQTRQAIERRGVPADFLPSHYDVDTYQDLQRLAMEVPGKDFVLKETRRVLENLRLLA